jgi:hypothetical protein
MLSWQLGLTNLKTSLKLGGKTKNKYWPTVTDESVVGI